MWGERKSSRPPPPCSRCGQPATFEAWGHPLCESCWGEWMRDERFTAGAIQRHLGQSDKQAAHARYCDEATRRTAAWVRDGRRARGAA